MTKLNLTLRVGEEGGGKHLVVLQPSQSARLTKTPLRLFLLELNPSWFLNGCQRPISICSTLPSVFDRLPLTRIGAAERGASLNSGINRRGV